MSDKEIRLLLGLDELFDTRLGTIGRLDPALGAELLAGDYYSSRPWDLFPGVDKQSYIDLYNKRDKRTLLESQSTPVIAIIRDFVKRCAKTALNNPVSLIPVIHVNTYPYNLTKEEEGKILGALTKLIPLKPTIEMVHLSPDELNPVFINMTYKTLIMYEGHKWMEKYSSGEKLLSKYPCRGVDLFVPAILDNPPEKVNILEPPKGFKEQLYSMSIFAQLFVNLYYIGVDNFCSYLAKKPELEASEEGLEDMAKDDFDNFKDETIPEKGQS